MNKTNRLVIATVIGVIIASLLACTGFIAMLPGVDSGPLWEICQRQSDYPWNCQLEAGPYVLCTAPILGVIAFAVTFFLLPKRKDKEKLPY